MATTDEPTAPTGTRTSPPRWVRVSAALGIVGVTTYVLGWIVAGAIRPGYDPVEQAISELFELGAPAPGRWLLTGSLVFSGVAFVAFGAAMDRGLPGRGRAGPAAAVFAGVMTTLVAFAPCSEGCPGFGSSATDTAHTLIAGSGYVALLATPLLTAPRLRPHAPRIAAWSVLLGGVALAGFAARYLGVLDGYGGLQQRVFNTIADAWLVVIAVWLLLLGRSEGRGEVQAPDGRSR